MRRDRSPGGEPEIMLSEEDGIRYLHFGTEWIQGAMCIARPFDIEIEYVQRMMAWLLFIEPPAEILQLGIGAAALTKFCIRGCPETRITAVEVSANVIDAARRWFKLPADGDRLAIMMADAGEFVARQHSRRRYGVIQIDLYDRDARGPVLDSLAFYSSCRRALTAPALVMVNLFGERPSLERNLDHLRQVFDDRIILMPAVPAGNRIAMAFVGPPIAIAWNALNERANDVERRYRLPALSWVGLLRRATCDDGQSLPADRLVI
jgi:spermidine synthase